VALAAVALVAFLVPGSKSRPVEWSALSVGPLQITYQQRRLFRDRRQLAAFLAQTGARRVPKIDFSSRQLLLLSTGARSSSGYAIDVVRASEKEDGITVEVRERSPAIGEQVDPHVTYPYRLISLPAGKDVFVEWTGR
jgi:protease stability complex PrcB-like protein